LNNVPVLAVDQLVEEKNGQHSVVGKTATLELIPGQAETLALSRQQGTLSLALRSMKDNNAKSGPSPCSSRTLRAAAIVNGCENPNKSGGGGVTNRGGASLEL
jgi:Flp pilus assembly protein CpaB